MSCSSARSEAVVAASSRPSPVSARPSRGRAASTGDSSASASAKRLRVGQQVGELQDQRLVGRVAPPSPREATRCPRPSARSRTAAQPAARWPPCAADRSRAPPPLRPARAAGRRGEAPPAPSSDAHPRCRGTSFRYALNAAMASRFLPCARAARPSSSCANHFPRSCLSTSRGDPRGIVQHVRSPGRDCLRAAARRARPCASDRGRHGPAVRSAVRRHRADIARATPAARVPRR